MKKAFFLTGLALLAVPARATPSDPPAPAPVPATPPVATPAPPAAPTPEELEASRLAVSSADMNRLLNDRAYAANILAHLDRLAALAEGNPEVRLAVDNLRLFALITQERPDEVRAGIDSVLAQRPVEASQYGGAWYGALTIEDIDRALAVIETASRNVPGIHWAELRGIIETREVDVTLNRFHASHQEDKRVRMAQALFRIGWTGGDVEESDFIRSILLEDRMRQHDNQAAADIAAGFSTPSQILPLVLQTRFDPVLPPGSDRLEMLRGALAARDRATAEALAAAPHDMQRVYDRARYLRGLGRDADALALLMPFTRDVRATIAAGSQGMWLISEASITLAAIGRGDQAIAMARPMLALPIAENSALIGPFINHAEVLGLVGRYAESLDYARMLQRNDAHYANAYGRMAISAAIVCALAKLNRSAEAAPDLAQMRAQSDANPVALTNAYLCVGDEDAAAALIVRRLQSDDPESAILALENYSMNHDDGRDAQFLARFAAVRARPEVREAFARVAHLLVLPLEQTFWG